MKVLLLLIFCFLLFLGEQRFFISTSFVFAEEPIDIDKYQIFRSTNSTVLQMENWIKELPYFIMHHCENSLLGQVEVVRASTETNFGHAFSSLDFLKILRGKKLSFFGDSLTRQLFNSIVLRLYPFQSDGKKEGKSFYFHFYKDYNATIVFCEDGFGHTLINDDLSTQNCSSFAIENADYLILGVSAWYKPFYKLEPKIEPDYMKNYKLSLTTYEIAIRSMRKQLELFYSRNEKFPKIIWRLSPHAGSSEEMNYKQYSRNIHSKLDGGKRTSYSNTPKHVVRPLFTQKDLFPHHNGELWTSLALKEGNVASWVEPFNNIVSHVAAEYKDSIFDWYKFSLKYIQVVGSMNITKMIHADSLHYCLMGVPVASDLYLFDVLQAIS
jgi:hypothetical protein